MWDISSSAADSLFAWSNIILIVGATLVLIGTIGSVKLASIREYFSDLRISDNERATTEAIAEAASAKAASAEANARAESERLERVRLEARIAPRRLSSQQKETIASALTNVPRPPTIAIVSRLLDTEGNDFADDISTTLTSAGWSTERFRNWTMGTKGLFVALVEGTTVSLNDPTIEGVQKALAAGDLDVKPLTIDAKNNATMSPYFQPNVLYVLVGAKP